MTALITLPTLQATAQALSGQTLAELAQALAIPLPSNLNHNKGFVGQLIEQALGVATNNQAGPDFAHLNIELKTIPVTATLKPRESTYVTTVPLSDPGTAWHDSVVYQKLQHVLWVPILVAETLPAFTIGKPTFWRPTPSQEAILKNDYDEIMDCVYFGEFELLSASLGEYLHVRPKAANAKALCWVTDAQGQRVQTLPRGFYLRSQFTKEILS